MTRTVQPAALALICALAAPAAFAQTSSAPLGTGANTAGTDPDLAAIAGPEASRGSAEDCSQLELSLGVRGAQCGTLTREQLGELRTDQQNLRSRSGG